MKSAFLTRLAWITFTKHIIIPRLDTGPPKNQSHAIRCVQVYVRAGEGKGRRKFERRAFVVAMTLQKRGHRAAAQSPPPTLKLRVNGVCPLFILPSPPCLPLGQISKAVRLSRPGLPPCHILLALVENGLALEEGSGIQTVHCS